MESEKGTGAFDERDRGVLTKGEFHGNQTMDSRDRWGETV